MMTNVSGKSGWDVITQLRLRDAELVRAMQEIEQLRAALQQIADAANYTAPEDIEARLHNEMKIYAIAKAALREESDEYST
jgi:hypothetical protein